MIVTGTGIASFCRFLYCLFTENTLMQYMFDDQAWLVFGVPVSGGLLYTEEVDCTQRNADSGQL